jgi:opacity protein-like surface antigen
MTGGTGMTHLAGVWTKGLIGTKKKRCRIPDAGVLVLLSASAAHAGCASTGLNPPAFPTQAAVTAVRGASASVGSLVSSINAGNTAFLTQSTAFIGSPANPQPDQEGGGIWSRGIGGHFSSSTTATAGNMSFGGAVAGSITCNTRTTEDFAGVQAGADVARLNVNGWNLHAGTMIGYFGSKTQEAAPPGSSPGASFRDTLQVPFIGIYGAASSGGFLVDGQVRGDFYQNELSDPSNGLSGQRSDARGITLIGNVAYNRSLGNNWFIEPSAGIIWSKTSIDPLNVPGTLVFGAGNVPPWVLTLNDIQSTLGRLGVRIGTSVTSSNMVVQPFAFANVFHEFQGRVTSNLASNYPAINSPFPPFSSTVSNNGLGTFSQVGLGVAVQAVNTGWVGYLRGDYRTGGNIEGWDVNGGLRYQFAPAPPAGEHRPMPAKAPTYQVSTARAAYNWTGLYIGAYLGADWGFTSWNFVGTGGTADPRFAGFLGGGEIGYNYQIGKWVFGVEGDAGWTNARGNRPCPSGFFFNCEVNMNLLSTATARIGYAYWDRLLLYTMAGAAIASNRAQLVCNTSSQQTVISMTGCPYQSDSRIKTGWTVGLGSEFGLAQNVSVKGEIMYFDLGTDRMNFGSVGADVQKSGLVSKVGLRFRFGG